MLIDFLSAPMLLYSHKLTSRQPIPYQLLRHSICPIVDGLMSFQSILKARQVSNGVSSYHHGYRIWVNKLPNSETLLRNYDGKLLISMSNVIMEEANPFLPDVQCRLFPPEMLSKSRNSHQQSALWDRIWFLLWFMVMCLTLSSWPAGSLKPKIICNKWPYV